MRSTSSGEIGPKASSRPVTTPSYDVASRQTGQSEPNISRPAPNQSTTDATNGRRSGGVQEAQVASVTIPDSFTATFGSAARSGMRCRHSGSFPSAMRGLAMWSSTNWRSGRARTVRPRLGAREPAPAGRRRAALLHGGEPSPNIGRAQPFGIGFVVDLVPEADQHGHDDVELEPDARIGVARRHPRVDEDGGDPRGQDRQDVESDPLPVDGYA